MSDPVDDIEGLNTVWRAILPNEIQRWAIFKYGTIVVCPDQDTDVMAHAVEVMREHGPIVAGTPLGDFNVGPAGSVPGWVVQYSHPDIGNYVSPDELDIEDPLPVEIGMIGREKRHSDFIALEIVYVNE